MKKTKIKLKRNYFNGKERSYVKNEETFKEETKCRK